MDIKEVSQNKAISTDLLRYFERIGIIPKIKRLKDGNREYDENDLKWLDFILAYSKLNFPQELLFNYGQIKTEDSKAFIDRRNFLVDEKDELKEKLVELQQCIAVLESLIASYNKII